ncbi:MAG: hypothetical protein HKN28_10900 [Alphaproteobacteria bacterium]|nr:hypothetical protein [Alphaproteobacteria bacterium]
MKIGTVTDRQFDPGSFEAVLQLKFSSGVRLPVDTQAVVTTKGKLGDKYLRLILGTATDRIAPGGNNSQTRGFRTLEDTVSGIVFPPADRRQTVYPYLASEIMNTALPRMLGRMQI